MLKVKPMHPCLIMDSVGKGSSSAVIIPRKTQKHGRIHAGSCIYPRVLILDSNFEISVWDKERYIPRKYVLLWLRQFRCILVQYSEENM